MYLDLSLTYRLRNTGGQRNFELFFKVDNLADAIRRPSASAGVSFVDPVSIRFFMTPLARSYRAGIRLRW